MPKLGSLNDLAGLPRANPARRPDVATVDVWCYFYEEDAPKALLARFAGLLSPNERQRLDRLRFKRDQLQFLATRALCRWVLSQYASIAPQDWLFKTGAQGKPFVANPHVDPLLWFNLSNTRGLVACAVSRNIKQIGIDVECLQSKPEITQVGERFFSPEEASTLRNLPPERQIERFFSYWTLKESFLKAYGTGLARGLASVRFRIEEDGTAFASFPPFLDYQADAWQFALFRASRRHLLALAFHAWASEKAHLRSVACIPTLGLTQLPHRF